MYRAPLITSESEALGLPLGDIKSSLETVYFRWRRKELSVFDERIESGREFQTVGAAARKEREPKIRLVRGTCKRSEEKDDLRTRDGRYNEQDKVEVELHYVWP